MTLSILILGASLTVLSSDILRDEFGIYDDTMPNPSTTVQIPVRNFYQRHKPAGHLPPLTQKNSSGPIRAENSQFKHKAMRRGSTLLPYSPYSPPKAPSRFSRSPSIFR